MSNLSKTRLQKLATNGFNIKTYKSHIDNFQSQYDAVAETIHDSNGTLMPAKIRGFFEENRKNTEHSLRLAKRLVAAYENANDVVQMSKDFFDSEEGQLSWDIQKDNNREKAKRKQIWWLWIQKTIRWTLGLFFAVFLYSFIVYWGQTTVECTVTETETCEVDFQIRMPIKDWFPSN